VELSDYAQALGAAQRLVPNWRQGDAQEADLATARMQPQLMQAQIARSQAQSQKEAQEVAFKEQRRAAFQSGLTSLGGRPTPQKLYQLSAQFPEFAAQIQGAAKGISTEDGAKVVRNLAPVQSLIQNGKYDLAAAEVKRHIDADKAAGIEPDEHDTELYGMLTSGDPDQAKSAGGIVYGLLSALNPETAAANLAKVSADKNKVVSAGGALVDENGNELYRASSKPEYRTIKNADGSESIVQVGGGDPASGYASPGYGGGSRSDGAAGGSSTAPGGRTRGGWTPRARNGGDNDDAAVDGKISGMTKALGIDPSAPFPPGMTNLQIAQALTLSEGGKGSIADRNNNPGNLTDPKTGGYRKFATKEAGLQAAAAQVARNRSRGQNTIQTMVEGLPAGGGTTAARPAPATSGAKVVFTSKPGSGNPVDTATVNFYAEKIAAGGDLPQLGSGKESSAWRRAILSRAAEIQGGRGVNGGESNLAQADVKANRSALLQAQKQYTSTVGFEDTFQRNAKEVLRLAPKGVGGSAPIFNRWIQSGRKSIKGDPAVSAFNVAVNTAANEYAKLASGASGGAVTSDSARHEAMEILNNAQTLPQLQASIKQMQIDGHNRVLALDTQIKRLRDGISGAGNSGRSQPAPAAAPQGGKLIGMYKGKQVFQLANGRRVVAR